MTNDEILTALRSKRGQLNAVELAELLGTLTGGLTQGKLVKYFQLAFPDIPLPVFLEAAGWDRVCDGELTDEGFNQTLRPWLEKSAEADQKAG
jgi:hypothetical protein